MTSAGPGYQRQNSMNLVALVIAVIVIVLVAWWFLVNNGGAPSTSPGPTQTQTQSVQSTVPSAAESGAASVLPSSSQ